MSELLTDLYSFHSCNGRSRHSRAHLLIRNIQECDTRYLRALLENDVRVIVECEELAKFRGYGPLIPCNYVASPSSQRQLCRRSFPPFSTTIT